MKRQRKKHIQRNGKYAKKDVLEDKIESNEKLFAKQIFNLIKEEKYKELMKIKPKVSYLLNKYIIPNVVNQNDKIALLNGIYKLRLKNDDLALSVFKKLNSSDWSNDKIKHLIMYVIGNLSIDKLPKEDKLNILTHLVLFTRDYDDNIKKRAFDMWNKLKNEGVVDSFILDWINKEKDYVVKFIKSNYLDVWKTKYACASLIRDLPLDQLDDSMIQILEYLSKSKHYEVKEAVIKTIGFLELHKLSEDKQDKLISILQDLYKNPDSGYDWGIKALIAYTIGNLRLDKIKESKELISILNQLSLEDDYNSPIIRWNVIESLKKQNVDEIKKDLDLFIPILSRLSSTHNPVNKLKIRKEVLYFIGYLLFTPIFLENNELKQILISFNKDPNKEIQSIAKMYLKEIEKRNKIKSNLYNQKKFRRMLKKGEIDMFLHTINKNIINLDSGIELLENLIEGGVDKNIKLTMLNVFEHFQLHKLSKQQQDRIIGILKQFALNSDVDIQKAMREMIKNQLDSIPSDKKQLKCSLEDILSNLESKENKEQK